jgi:RNA polymerase sigma-70 factor (ECF subfamily)
MDAQEDTQSAHARFEAMYRGEAGVVLMFATHRVGRAAADDIVADTFAVAWSKLGEVPSPPRAWLLVTARKIISNYLRSQKRHPTDQLRDNHAAWIDDVAEGVAVRRELLEAVAQLSKHSREAVTLAAWYDLSQREMAQVMGCSVTAAGVRLHRGRKQLRQLLEASDRPLISPITEVQS